MVDRLIITTWHIPSLCRHAIHYSAYFNFVVQGQDMDQILGAFSSAIRYISIIHNTSGSLPVHRWIGKYWVRYVYHLPTTHREIRFAHLLRLPFPCSLRYRSPGSYKIFSYTWVPLFPNCRRRFSGVNSVCCWWLVFKDNETPLTCSLGFRTNYYRE